MPIVGSFAGASSRAYGLQAGIIVGDFESIETVTVGSGAVTSITFSSIPQTYTHLQLRILVRDARAVTINSLYMRFNSDTGSNYSYHTLDGNGSSATSSAGTSQTFNAIGLNASASLTSNIFSVHIVDILDYRDTNKFKTSRCLYGVDANGSGNVGLHSSNWRSTSAITSINIFSSSGPNLAQYSSFALYGIKG